MDDIHCLNPHLCTQLARHRQHEWELVLPTILKLYDGFLTHPRHAILTSMHGMKRMEERQIDPRDVRAVIECCAPIEYTFTFVPYYRPPEVHNFLIAGERADGRPLHVACTLPPDPPEDRWILRIRSVYDPSTLAFEWSADYATRRCFCYGAARRYLNRFEQELKTTQGEKS
jgi:hypothetical protein